MSCLYTYRLIKLVSFSPFVLSDCVCVKFDEPSNFPSEHFSVANTLRWWYQLDVVSILQEAMMSPAERVNWASKCWQSWLAASGDGQIKSKESRPPEHLPQIHQEGSGHNGCKTVAAQSLSTHVRGLGLSLKPVLTLTVWRGWTRTTGREGGGKKGEVLNVTDKNNSKRKVKEQRKKYYK